MTYLESSGCRAGHSVCVQRGDGKGGGVAGFQVTTATQPPPNPTSLTHFSGTASRNRGLVSIARLASARVDSRVVYRSPTTRNRVNTPTHRAMQLALEHAMVDPSPAVHRRPQWRVHNQKGGGGRGGGTIK
jgi:hypothetical protein